MKSTNGNAKIQFGGGAGICTILQIVFVVLKLTDTVDWSWWVVLIPAYVAVALSAVGVAAAIIAVICQILIDHIDD